MRTVFVRASSSETIPIRTITSMAIAYLAAHCCCTVAADMNPLKDTFNSSDTRIPSPSSSSAQSCNANATTSSTPPAPSLMGLIFIFTDSFLKFCSQSHVTTAAVSRFHSLLLAAGVPSNKLPTADEICLSLMATVTTLLLYFVLFGKRHVKRRQRLAYELRMAQLQVHYLEEKLILAAAEDLSHQASSSGSRHSKNRPIRIFMDGAFDMMHYGHMNAFRLGKSLGTHLIVGVNSDESIRTCKGTPLMNDRERLTMVQGCKFVDEVVPGCPYVMSKEYLDYVIQTLKVDYVVHGDDPCIVNGRDVYAAAKQSGKYQTIPRTEGVSTTDIVGRMLLMTKDHHYFENQNGEEAHHPNSVYKRSALLGQQSKFLTTSRMLRLFSAGVKAPEKGMRVVYMDGAWDMFHCGHVAILNKAKQRGDYLIVGIHGDAIVNQSRGSNMPLMNLHERVLSVLGCRFVDDVLIDAPYVMTPEMIASLNIAEVVHGSKSDFFEMEPSYDDRYKVPRDAGIFKIIESPSHFTMAHIVSRIQKNQETFQAKFDQKKLLERDYYDRKYRTNGSD